MKPNYDCSKFRHSDQTDNKKKLNININFCPTFMPHLLLTSHYCSITILFICIMVLNLAKFMLEH